MADTILIPAVDRVNLYGNVVELSGLSQRGLAVVRKIVPDAVTEVERKTEVKTITHAEPTEKSTEPKAGAKRGRKPKGGDSPAAK